MARASRSTSCTWQISANEAGFSILTSLCRVTLGSGFDQQRQGSRQYLHVHPERTPLYILEPQSNLLGSYLFLIGLMGIGAAFENFTLVVEPHGCPVRD